eukprot:gb/GECH01013263.1/.p1 GENE.gb/GECH01013263.1/~~gb/GECH01013263.1/.p1  ORF type:complete len:297 (+),score=69.45 gb/GECH01013263.1/:1-891(+)
MTVKNFFVFPKHTNKTHITLTIISRMLRSNTSAGYRNNAQITVGRNNSHTNTKLQSRNASSFPKTIRGPNGKKLRYVKTKKKIIDRDEPLTEWQNHMKSKGVKPKYFRGSSLPKPDYRATINEPKFPEQLFQGDSKEAEAMRFIAQQCKESFHSLRKAEVSFVDGVDKAYRDDAAYIDIPWHPDSKVWEDAYESMRNMRREAELAADEIMRRHPQHKRNREIPTTEEVGRKAIKDEERIRRKGGRWFYPDPKKRSVREIEQQDAEWEKQFDDDWNAKVAARNAEFEKRKINSDMEE